MKYLISLALVLLIVSPVWAETVVFSDGRGCKGCKVHWVDKKARIADYITEKDGSVYYLQDGETFTVYKHPMLGNFLKALSTAAYSYDAAQRRAPVTTIQPSYTPYTPVTPTTSTNAAIVPSTTPSIPSFQSYGTYNLFANDGTYLGNTGNQYDSNSVNNPYGKYGSQYSTNSINNPYGNYGSPYSITSPNNPYSEPGIASPQFGGADYQFGGWSK